jgi:hypothetical protein
LCFGLLLEIILAAVRVTVTMILRCEPIDTAVDIIIKIDPGLVPDTDTARPASVKAKLQLTTRIYRPMHMAMSCLYETKLTIIPLTYDDTIAGS